MIKPVIVTVGYNRPEKMKRLLESIGRAHFDYDDIHLVVSIDESDLSDEVEKVAREFNWQYGTKEIRRFPERQGLRKHIVQCGDYSERYGAVIILEDDLIVAEDFYSYTCAAHEKYSEDDRICGVSLYSFLRNQFTGQFFTPTQKNSYDAYLGGMVVTWGQSWTASQWKQFKKWYMAHEDKLPDTNHLIPDEISGWTRSWGRYFVSYMAEKEKYYVYPYVARSTCFADFGEHSVNKIAVTCVQVPLMTGHTTSYCFGEVDDLVCYDSFYERVLPEEIKINGIPGNEICMDLNCMKKSANGRKYIISNDELPYKKVCSFGLVLKPIEMNVLQNLNGNEIFMYEKADDCDVFRQPKKKKYQYKLKFSRLRYEFADMSYRVAINYTFNEILMRIKER